MLPLTLLVEENGDAEEANDAIGEAGDTEDEKDLGRSNRS